VYGLLRTSDALSKAVTANQVWFSLIMFTVVYILLFSLFVFLMNRKIQHGPFYAKEINEEIDEDEHSPKLKAMAGEFGK